MITYFVPYSFGGSADYSACQIKALLAIGIDIELVAPDSFVQMLDASEIGTNTIIIDRKPRKFPLPFRAAFFIRDTLSVMLSLSKHLKHSKSDYILLGDYSEYLAPMWIPMLKRRKMERGLRFGCILHDPVRNFVRGPEWWHKWSVNRAFELIDDIFIHGPPPNELVSRFPHLNVIEVPHGVYSENVVTMPTNIARDELGLPCGVPILLQFGHVRDGKNIEILIESLTVVKDCHLIIAGKEVSGTQRDGSYYRDLAKRLGVDSRVHFRLGFVSNDEIPILFSSADVVCLIYDKTFRSMSGVLAHALNYEKPVIASGGDGPLKHLVNLYGLGEWVEAIDVESVGQAIAKVLANEEPHAAWQACRREASWERNAELVAAVLNQ